MADGWMTDLVLTEIRKGGDVTPTVLREMTGLGADDLRAALDDLVKAGKVEATDDGWRPAEAPSGFIGQPEFDEDPPAGLTRDIVAPPLVEGDEGASEQDAAPVAASEDEPRPEPLPEAGEAGDRLYRVSVEVVRTFRALSDEEAIEAGEMLAEEVKIASGDDGQVALAEVVAYDRPRTVWP